MMGLPVTGTIRRGVLVAAAITALAVIWGIITVIFWGGWATAQQSPAGKNAPVWNAQVVTGTGSDTAPAVRSAADADTGIRFSSNGQEVYIVLNGVQRGRFQASTFTALNDITAGGGAFRVLSTTTETVVNEDGLNTWFLRVETDNATSALVTLPGSANGVEAVRLGVGLQQRQGGNLTAANNLQPLFGGTGGNTFYVTGTTQINCIDSGWARTGTVIRLVFDSTPTVAHAQVCTAPFEQIWLHDRVDLVARNRSSLTLVRVSDGSASYWQQTGGTY